ncbi:UDP-N-acetylglucosamine transferase subunit ALG13 [Parastagonospora nodorum]|nr:UDP-N-acetylglucosamine transferase subunit ALG13 [Parastagonospora nodorum]KAH4121162.1 UDP-N-acetylglucosamine transferase subunit ALG13 [Parastagonospora nodorum]KAH4252828.1 UDP-N-acetylglucosamine transferase subunit ALG13 [Parastagonospora nodorum]KAH4276755.1 UDP-N-acetylglucosamine transferase subunit ALG13 [Parastagonospora nodorum]KAH4309985.1 UDP-N-acetylglucosamine transferase subunit ALG13 [Parastagonospora nodorum]
MTTTSTHVVLSVAWQDAGDTTRAISMAIALRDMCPAGYELKVDFLSCGSRFEYQIKDAGFNIVPAQPRVKGISVAHDLGWDWPEFFGSEEIAKTFIDGQLAAFREMQPDIVFHGMWAPASIAARLLGIRTINFLPVPLHPGAFAQGLVRDLPDMMPLFTRLPRPIRKQIAWWASGLMIKAPIFRQKRLGAAAAACGWPAKGPISLFDMNMADLNLVNDHPIFHKEYLHLIPENFFFTGPLYASNDSELDEDISKHLKKGPGPSILVTMGSSGTEEFLFEAIKALRLDPEDDWTAVVLASKSICSIDRANEIAAGDPRLLVTDRFIPAPAANALADVVITHGGQGTVQCALAAGKPIVGVALQVEQQTNLDNAMNAGAGVRIQKQSWKAKNIRSTVLMVLKNPQYAVKARMLAETLNSMDGATTAAKVMWSFILEEQDEKLNSGDRFVV